MRAPRPRTQLQNDLIASTLDGTVYSVMVGIGEAYVPAFALAIGVGDIAAGLLASVPLLAGAALQLLAPFFTPYTLQGLGLSYAGFTLVTSSDRCSRR